MSKPPSDRSSAPTRDERLAKALRDNLSRRKALKRAQQARGAVDDASTGQATPDRKGEPPS